MPDNQNRPTNPGTVSGAINEIKTFIKEPLSTKVSDLEKIVEELTNKLAPVLKGAGEKALEAGKAEVSSLLNDQDSPLYKAAQETKDLLQNAHSGFERVRNRISGLIDRLHIE